MKDDQYDKLVTALVYLAQVADDIENDLREGNITHARYNQEQVEKILSIKDTTNDAEPEQ